MSNNPYNSPAPVYHSNATGYAPKPISLGPLEIVWPLVEARKWLKFLGWMNIILGGIYCLTIIGIIFGWVPIWIGISLKGAGDKLEVAMHSQDSAAAHYACRDLRTVFTIVGVLAIISLVLTALYFLGLIAFFVFALVAANNI